jgi:ribonucleoside-diphosphate reductase alpha chain
MQAAFQKWTDNAITKTINMPSSVAPGDVLDAYVSAWKLGCKGLTIYRDGTKLDQVFEFGGSRKESSRKCPDCQTRLVKEGKCYKCKSCGFSTCDV